MLNDSKTMALNIFLMVATQLDKVVMKVYGMLSISDGELSAEVEIPRYNCIRHW